MNAQAHHPYSSPCLFFTSLSGNRPHLYRANLNALGSGCCSHSLNRNACLGRHGGACLTPAAGECIKPVPVCFAGGVECSSGTCSCSHGPMLAQQQKQTAAAHRAIHHPHNLCPGLCSHGAVRRAVAAAGVPTQCWGSHRGTHHCPCPGSAALGAAAVPSLPVSKAPASQCGCPRPAACHSEASTAC